MKRINEQRAAALAFCHECLAQDLRNEWPGDRGAWVAAEVIRLLTGKNVEHKEGGWASGKWVWRPVRWSRERRWVRV